MLVIILYVFLKQPPDEIDALICCPHQSPSIELIDGDVCDDLLKD